MFQDSFARFEQQVQARLSRGKIEILVRWQAVAGGGDRLEINDKRLTDLLAALERVGSVTDTRPPTPLDLLQWPGIIEGAADNEAALVKCADALFEEALTGLVETREREGDKLERLIRDRLRQVKSEVEATRARLPELLTQQRERILGRLGELDLDVDEGRIEQELVMLAQKIDVEEELDRLEAHVEEVERVLARGGPCGRRLDFLMQELNREANTLSSKSIASSTTQHAVELKVLIEQMREQIQNLE